jgi:nucleoside-diphosphate-sugar epimerase
MNVLVTGGTGFVGSHLIEALRAGGGRVRAIVRRSGDRDTIARLGGEPVVGDLEDAESLEQACRGCEVVYHAAAKVDIVGGYASFHRTTVTGTARLIAAARRAGVRRFVYISSCGVYHPRLLHHGVIDENTPTPPPPRWFAYGRAKLEAEHVVRRDVQPPAEWVIVRLGYLYGPRNRAMHLYVRPLMTTYPVMFIGRGDNDMAMLYVTDAVRAIVAAGRTPDAAGRTLIAAGEERVTQKDYIDAMADGFGVPRARRHVPYRLAYALAWLNELTDRLKRNNGRPVINRSAVVLTGLPQRIDGSRTRRLLGWTPSVRFADGIRETFDWYRREYAST